MEEINYLKEACLFANIPACPKKEWDGKRSFDTALVVVEKVTGVKAFAIGAYDSEKDTEVRVKKVFGQEPFTSILNVFPVPNYMEDDIEKMQLETDESKEAMEQLLQEKKELINEGTEPVEIESYEWGYPFITNNKQAVAYLKSQNVKGRIPTSDDVLKAKLKVMYLNENKNKK